MQSSVSNPVDSANVAASSASTPAPAPSRGRLPGGIVSVVQTAFTADGALDLPGVERLVDDAIAAGVDGFLVPVVASEVARLDEAERSALVATVAARARGRVPVIVGASADTPEGCLMHARRAMAAGAGQAAVLVAVPAQLYGREEEVVAFFGEVAAGLSGPLVIQDLQFQGPGLSLDCLAHLWQTLPNLAGFKIETTPAGWKYSAVRQVCGAACWIAGGWAVPQMIEALDRGVDAMVPESSMIRVYQAVVRRHRAGDRAGATRLFRKLLPVLAFSNQELSVSVAFFKRLLVRKGIFDGAHQRMPLNGWDATCERVAVELIRDYLELEAEVREV